MVKQMGVGHATLREALRLLESRGLITIKMGREGGPVVRHPRGGDLSVALALILRFEDAGLHDILDARSGIEPLVAREAAVNITDDLLAVLRGHVDGMTEGFNEMSDFRSHHSGSHSTIGLASGSIVLRVFSDALERLLDGVVMGVDYSPRRRAAAVDSHVPILEALEARDPDGAEAAMREHIDDVGAFWRSKYAHLFERNIGPIRIG